MSKYATNIQLRFTDTTAITKFAEEFCEVVFNERCWTHLEKCRAYNIGADLRTEVDDPSALYMNRFNEGYYSDADDPFAYDYYGVRGYPLIELFPEWLVIKEKLESHGLKLMVDSPCVLVTNRAVAVHRDGTFPEPEGYTSREAGLNYLLFDNSGYMTGAWEDDHHDWGKGDFVGIEHTEPACKWKYSDDSMILVNTFNPHGSYIDPEITPPPKYAPRAFITIGLEGKYADVYEKLVASGLVISDWG